MTEYFAIIRNYNFWDKPLPSLGLLREKYIDKLSSFIGNKLIKVLTGQRRSGKSYLLRQIIYKLINQGVTPSNIFYLNKEISSFDFIKSYKDLEILIEIYKKEIKPIGKIYLLIDEIQLIDSWEILINSYSQDYISDYEIFITGSNSKMLSGELATLLSGRYVQFNIFTFSYLEFTQILKLENTKPNFIKYLNTGGLPELFNLPDIETKQHYVQALKDTVLLRDIIQHYHIKDAKLLEELFSYLINNASNFLSINNIVNYYQSKKRKVHYDTVANYIEYLCNAFLVHKVDKFNIRGKEILSGSIKFYINDLSFRNYLYPGFAYGIGYLLENLIYLQLVNAGFKVYVGLLRNKEIDFVAIKDDRTLYVQSAYLLENQETIEREYAGLRAIHDNYEKYVVSLDDIQLSNYEGIKHIQAWNFSEIL